MARPHNRRQETGKLGEQLAVVYLCEQCVAEQWRIRDRNWRCTSGEIDLVAEQDGRIVFIEVRTRTSAHAYGTAAESVNTRKQQKIKLNARMYLAQHRLDDVPVRFDVIALTLDTAGQLLSLDHYRDAF